MRSSHGAVFVVAIAATASLATAQAPKGYVYNCAVGLDVWKYTWSKAKRAYCCEHEKKGCQADTTPLKAEDNYSCSPGSVGEMGVAERAWCCVHHSVGCPHISGAGTKVSSSLTEPFDPNAVKEPQRSGSKESTERVRGPTNSASTPSAQESIHAQVTGKKPPPVRVAQDGRFIASSTTTTTSTTTTNTRTATRHNETTTTHYRTTTRRTTTTTRSYDCRRALSHWMTAWSMEKKEWCCTHHRAGCLRGVEEEKDERHFNCKEGFWTCQDGWSQEKTTWCWKNKGIVCGVDSYNWIFDCSAGYPNWKSGWSAPKKAWCCRHYTLGCERRTTTTTTMRAEFDCNADYESSSSAWSPDKKTWCCRNFKMGCQNFITFTTTRTTTPFFDCEAGSQNAKNAWSKAKKDWCCRHGGRGCTSAQYDCEEGERDWEASWGVNKKFYCCATAGKGCPSGGNFSMAMAMAKYSERPVLAAPAPAAEAWKGRLAPAAASAAPKLALVGALLGAAALVALRQHRRATPPLPEPEVANPFITETAS